MVNSVNTGSYNSPTQHSLSPPGQRSIRVREEIDRGGEQFGCKHSGHGRRENRNSRKEHGLIEHQLERMKANRGGNVVVGVRMMNLVDSPKKTDRVKGPVRQIANQIEQRHGGNKSQTPRQPHPVQYAEPAPCHHRGHHNAADTEYNPAGKAGHSEDNSVATPAAAHRIFRLILRKESFPDGNPQECADKQGPFPQLLVVNSYNYFTPRGDYLRP